MTKGFKMLAVAAVIAVINVIVLSPGLIGVEIGGESDAETAFGITMLFASLIGMIYVFFFKKEEKISVKNLTAHEDYTKALAYYLESKVLKNDVSFALEQARKLSKKKETLAAVLSQRFEPTELSYQKFNGVIAEVEKLFYINIRNILNKMSIFDESDYLRIIGGKTATRYSPEILQEKTELYEGFIQFIKEALNINEEILLDLDKLLLEITRLDNVDIEDVDDMEAMKELDALIKQTKYYKQ